MIADKLENIHLYSGLNKNIFRALKYIGNTDFTLLQPGKYAIDRETIFALVSEYETKDASSTKPEAHKKYIDVQFIVSGEEFIGYAPLTGQRPSVDYDACKDIAFYDEEVSFLKMEAGMFAVFYPGDLHQPCIKAGKPVKVKKVVIKVMDSE